MKLILFFITLPFLMAGFFYQAMITGFQLGKTLFDFQWDLEEGSQLWEDS